MPANVPEHAPANAVVPNHAVVPTNAVVDVDGHRLALSNLDKVLYPSTGTTKADVIDYYRRVAPVMLPHLADRPPTLVRAPDGVGGDRFFEKRCPRHRPAWLRTAPVTDYDGCRVENLAGLIWLANLAAIELHTHQWRTGEAASIAVVIDLDPGPGCSIGDCCRVALALRDVLDGLGLLAFAKTSGSKGIHLSIPLNGPGADHEATKTFALALGRYLEARDGVHVTTNMAKQQRTGRVFVDWSQNDRHKTTVAPYSLRLRERPTVSTPVSWGEVEDAMRGADSRPGSGGAALDFDLHVAADRAETLGDLWAPSLSLVQSIPDLRTR
jgi:bifunctional non-homologous end joining protein LigD